MNRREFLKGTLVGIPAAAVVAKFGPLADLLDQEPPPVNDGRILKGEASYAAESYTWPSVSGEEVTGLEVTVWTKDEAKVAKLAWDSGTVGLPITPNGSDITVSWGDLV